LQNELKYFFYKYFSKIEIWVSKTQTFDADLESVEKFAKKTHAKKVVNEKSDRKMKFFAV
jgi:hypothetical protein